MRTLLYTGKGGVGKTSVAAATGLTLSKRGYRTIVISTDPAHSLGDSYDMTLGPETEQVAPNLWAHEIDIFHELNSYWETVQEWLAALTQWQGVEGVIAEEMAVLPGMEELMGLLEISQHHEEGNYDVVIVDCAPTAETLRLLSFPEMARWYMKKIFPIERKVATALGPVARTLLKFPVPKTSVFNTIQDLFDKLEEMRLILTGPTSSIRLVVNPEKMVVKEALRTYTYLNLYGYTTDLVVCNRVLPDGVKDSFFDNWRSTQKSQLQFIEESFSPLPIWTVPFMDREVVGLDALEEMGNFLYNGRDPAEVLYKGHPQEIIQTDSGYTMELDVPFTSQEELSVIHRGSEVAIQAGQHRRNLSLPRVLAGMSIAKAKLEDSTLRLQFVKEDATKRRQAHGRREDGRK